MAITTEITHTDGSESRAPSASGVVAVIGTSSLGTNGQVKEFRRSNYKAMQEHFGDGDLVRKTLELFRGPVNRVLMAKVNDDVAAEIGAVVKRVDATTTGSMTVTGTATGTFDIVVQVTKAGDIGTATFKVSKDGGDTFSDDVTSASTYVIPNTGLTLNLTGGADTAFIKDDKYEVHVKGATGNVTNTQAAVDNLVTAYKTNGKRFEALYIAFPVAKAFATTLSAKIDTMRSTEFIFAIPCLEAEMPKAPLELDGTSDKFSIQAPGTGINAIATATDITPAATAGQSQDQVATDLQTKINAAAAGPSPNWTVTAQVDGTFKLDASGTSGVTSITIAAPSANDDATNQLFGTITDQDSTADTWTGKLPSFEKASAWDTRIRTDWSGFGHDSFIVCAGGYNAEVTGGKAEVLNCAPYFLGRGISAAENRSPSAPEDGSYPGVLSVHPDDYDETIRANLRGALFTAVSRTRLGKLTTEEDLVMKVANSGMKYFTWLRIENAILTTIVDIMDDFKNRETDAGSIATLEKRLNSPIRDRKTAGKIADGRVVIPDGQNFATATEITVDGWWSPFGRFANFKLKWSLVLPNTTS